MKLIKTHISFFEQNWKLGNIYNSAEILNLHLYSKEDLQALNFLDCGTASDTNFHFPASKEQDVERGYDDITHFTTKDGHDVFVVLQEDKSTITYSTFTDGNENQASYQRSSDGSVNVSLSNADGSTRTIISNENGYNFDSYGFKAINNECFELNIANRKVS